MINKNLSFYSPTKQVEKIQTFYFQTHVTFSMFLLDMRFKGIPSFSGIRTERSNFLQLFNCCSAIFLQTSKPAHHHQDKIT